jgi:AAA domain
VRLGSLVGASDSVIELAFARWGVRPVPAHERFTEPGWSYAERVPRPCPRCAGTLYTFRKPYVTAGRTQRYVAVLCPACPGSFLLSDLGLRTYDQLLRADHEPRARRPSEPASGGATAGAAGAEGRRRAQVLRYWRSVELFASQRLDEPDPAARRYEIRPGQPMPWQEGHRLRRMPLRKDRVWRHTLFGGVFARDRLHAALERVFGESGPDVDERVPRGASALFAAVVTEDGRLLLDSLVLSSAAWAGGRAYRPGPGAVDWLDGFDAAAQRFAATVREAVAAAADDDAAKAAAEDGMAVSRPLSQANLLTLVDLAAEQLGVVELLAPDGLRVNSETVGRKRAGDVQVDFLNSFYVDDLARVAAAIAVGECGAALESFLTADESLPALRRVDVRDPAMEDRLLELLAPSRVPAGRWPANTNHPLATSQQLAINAITEQLGCQPGLFAVNGPPGTGKTTMLRDLVAALVVQRAVRLAELPTPEAGFERQLLAWRTDRTTRWIRPPRADLTGFEVVVASANNGAVANVTREIPLYAAIDEAWAGQADYFAEHATRLLGEPAWGLIAARLGNRANCGEFAGRFWYGDPADPGKKPGEDGPGFRQWLTNLDQAGAAPDWGSAVAAFRAAAAGEQLLRQDRQRAYEALRQLPELREAEQRAQRAWQLADQEHRAAAGNADETGRAARVAAAAAHIARQRRQEHRATKPGLWEMLFTVGQAIRRWHTEDEPLAAACKAADTTTAWTAAAAHAANYAAAQARHLAAAAAADRDQAVRRLAATQVVLTTAQSEFGAHMPDSQWLADATRRELAGPWLDETWNAARTRLFLAALDLHAAFLAGAAPIVRTNLRAAMEVVTGQAPPDASEPALRQAWQSLFLVVPVVSTTFASVGRLLGRLGQEALGWLLIDEAGQATPQAAVGAMWRARRVIAIGDPLQLEPVVTVLHTTQAALARHHRVADTWLPGHASVQGLTDRVSTLGTWLPGPDGGQVWVGAPLRVHRRCDDPMFTIVNRAVYAGLMINGTQPHHQTLTVRDSAWIDITATAAQGHWIPAEGDAAARVLAYLDREGVPDRQIMAITPFRDGARQLRQLLARRYPNLVHGTVHTAQGKEADVVLFILGGNPAKPGARAWAASRPNLFNVAVSRARQRLYVIGNHGNWAKLPYFSTLAAELPVRQLQPPRQDDQ